MGNYNRKQGLKPDLERAYAFLQLLDPDAKTFHFQVYHEDNGNKSAKEFQGGLYDLEKELVSYNASRHAVGVSVNEIREGQGRTIRNVKRIRAIVIDDDKTRPKPRSDFPLEPSIIVESSPGKCHYYWLCDDVPVSKFQAIEKTLVERYGHDGKVTAGNCILRLTGFIHQKNEPFRTRIFHASLARYSAADIFKAFPPATENPSSVYFRNALSKADRVRLKHGGQYDAQAVAWTWAGKNRITLRYSVQTDNGDIYLDQYLNVKQFSRMKTIAAGVDTKLHNDLKTLRPDVDFDFSHLPISVIDEYFDRKLKVMVITVFRKRDPTRPGHFLPRQPSAQYSKVECVYSVSSKMKNTKAK